MIQWIALAVAVDANDKAGQARATAEQAEHNSKSGSSLVIVRPVDLVTDESDLPPNGAGFFGRMVHIRRKILDKEPWATLSIKKADIINLEEHKDGLDQPYVTLRVSEYAKISRPGWENYIIKLRVPGTIEQVAGAIGGV